MNKLFPIFIKLDQVQVLLVGAGYVGHEKLTALLRQDPEAHIHIVATWISSDVQRLIHSHPNITFVLKRYSESDLESVRLVLAATDDKEVNAQISRDARRYGLIANVADTPDLCDFYLGSIVTKGNLKVGISTNGKSPTFAKRFREYLEQSLPEETDELLDHLNAIRDNLDTDFAEKVRVLNELTKDLKLN